MPATAMMSAVPQMLRPGPPPRTRQATAPASKETCVIAPATARLPQAICAPSNAGPAAAEVAASTPPRASTISPLVPMSRAREVPSAAGRPSATITPTVSAPTKAEISGSVSTIPLPWKPQPKSAGGRRTGSVTSGMYGAWVSCTGSSPSRMWIMIGLPTTTVRTTFAAATSVSSRRASAASAIVDAAARRTAER